MKKIIALILSALTAFAFVACGEKETKKPAPETAQTGETGQKQTSQTAEKPVLGDPNIVHPDLTNGTLYTLEEACDKNLLTQEELMHAAYYWMGEVVEVVQEVKGGDYYSEYKKSEQEWVNLRKIPFTPTKDLDSPSTDLDAAIRSSFCVKYAEKIADSIAKRQERGKESTVEDYAKEVGIDDFLGEFNGKFVMTLNQGLWERFTDFKVIAYNGLLFYDRPTDFFVYIVNKG